MQPAQLEGASPKMDCNEKKTRCQDLSELIKRKETEVEKKNFQHMRLSGESGIDFDRKEKKARIPSPAEIASSNELKQLRDQIHALKDELFQCERTECANYSKK